MGVPELVVVEDAEDVDCVLAARPGAFSTISRLSSLYRSPSVRGCETRHHNRVGPERIDEDTFE